MTRGKRAQRIKLVTARRNRRLGAKIRRTAIFKPRRKR